MSKNRSSNDNRSINLNPQHPGGSKNLSHNATQGTGSTTPAPAPTVSTPPPANPSKK